MISKLRQVIFFLVIFSIPNQLGFHFWPSFSYINGIRIDYLSPTLYLSDILIIFLFLLLVLDLVKKSIKIKFPQISDLIKVFSLLFVLDLILALFFAKSVQAHLFGVVKILEFSFLSVYTANTIKFKKVSYFVDVLALGGLLSCALAILQFISQSSIGGLWYFMGERSFNLSSLGIAAMNINGNLILRPYASFPHPNVLAFFMFFVLLMVSIRIPFEKNFYEKVFLYFTFILCTIGLFLTFSRVIILCYLVVYGFIFAKKIIGKNFKGVLYSLPFVLIFFLYTFHYYSRFLSLKLLARDILFRVELINISFLILKENFLLGVGLNNFFIHEVLFQKNISATIFQPVHNIFILTLVEVGIFASFILPIILFYSLKNAYRNVQKKTNIEIKNFYKSIFILISCIIVVGSFDHFFLTVQQGILMFSIILGAAFSNIKVSAKAAGADK